MPSQMDRLEEPDLELPRGMHLRADPEEVPPGLVLDLCNCLTAEPYGTLRPRHGSRSLAAAGSAKLGGHPLAPLGNALLDGTAEILRLIEDEARRRLYAIVKTGENLARVYIASTAETRPGFDLVTPSDEFALDTSRPPSVEIYQGRLFVPAGVSESHKNIAFDAITGATVDSEPSPKQVAVAGISAAGSGSAGIYNSYGYNYKFCYTNSVTGAESMPSAAKAVAAYSGPKAIAITAIPGANSITVWDRIRIYRTTDGGTIFRYLAEISNVVAGSTTSYSDTTPDDKLSYRQLPERHGRVPTCRFCLCHNDRMLYGVQTEPPFDGSIVYFSEPYAPFNVDPAFNFVSIRPDDGGAMSLMLRVYNRVFVVKTNGAIYELIDLRPNAVYGVDPIVNEGPWGCVSPATFQEIDGVAHWLCHAGWCRFSGDGLPSLTSFPVQAKLTAARPIFVHRAIVVDTTYTTSPKIAFNVANNDICRETIQLKVRFSDTALVLTGDTPDDPDSDHLVAGFDTDDALDLPLWKINELSPAVSGYPLNAGSTAAVKLTLSKHFRQTITVTGDTGHWHVGYRGEASATEIAPAATAATVEAVINALTTLDRVVTVTRTGSASPYVYTVVFAGPPETAEALTTTATTLTAVVAGYHAMIAGTDYWCYARAYDGLEWGAWTLIPITGAGVGGSTKTYEEWTQASKAWSVADPERNEIWIGVPDPVSDRVNEVWVLDTNTLQADTGPQWRRHRLHATAAIYARSIAGFRGLVLGDSLGLVWTYPDGDIDHDVDRDDELEDLEGDGVLRLAAGVWTLGVGAATWPTTSASECGLLGQRVTVSRQGTPWETWTGIVLSHTADTLTLGLWVGDEPPADLGGDAWVDYAVGGIATHAQTHLQPQSGDPNTDAQIKTLMLRTEGEIGTAALIAELQWADRQGPGPAADHVKRRRLETAVQTGRHRFPLIGVRGRYAALRIGGFSRGQSWTLAGWGLGLIKTGVGR